MKIPRAAEISTLVKYFNVEREKFMHYIFIQIYDEFVQPLINTHSNNYFLFSLGCLDDELKPDLVPARAGVWRLSHCLCPCRV